MGSSVSCDDKVWRKTSPETRPASTGIAEPKRYAMKTSADVAFGRARRTKTTRNKRGGGGEGEGGKTQQGRRRVVQTCTGAGGNNYYNNVKAIMLSRLVLQKCVRRRFPGTTSLRSARNYFSDGYDEKKNVNYSIDYASNVHQTTVLFFFFFYRCLLKYYDYL